MANKPTYEELEKRVRELEQAESERKRAENALQESEGRYRQLFENSMVGIGLADKSGRVLAFNNKMVEITGYSKDDISRLNLTETYVNKEDREGILEIISKEGKLENFEIQLINKQGTSYWANLSIKPIKYKGEDVLLTSAINITDRKRAEDALRESEAILNMASRMARFGGWSTHPDRQEVVWSEQVALIHEKQPGYSPTVEEAIQNYTPEWRDKIAEVFQKCIREGTPYDEEMEIITAGGHRLWVRTTGEAVRDNTGKIVRVQGSFQDITERKQAEDALKDSQMQIKAMADSSFEAIFLSEKGICLDQNPAAEKMFGYTKAENVGKNPISNFVPEDHERVNNFVMSGYEKPYIVTAIRKDGTTFPCEIQARQTTYHGRSVRIASCRDITDRIKAQKIIQKEKTDLKKEILKRTVDLKETNTALNVLLKKRERDKTDVEEKVIFNVKVMIEPYLKKLKKSMLNDKQMIYLNILESNVKEIISPFGQTLSSRLISLTPTELKVANLVKQGKTTKQIAVLSNVSPETISCHRKNIRKKLNLTEKKTNLRTSLSSLI